MYDMCAIVNVLPYSSYVSQWISFTYFASRWPFTKLKSTKIRFSTSGNKAHIRENINRENFVKPTFACFREI